MAGCHDSSTGGRLRSAVPPFHPPIWRKSLNYEIDDHEAKRLGLTLTGDFDVIQSIELPEAPVHVTEHRLAVYEDTDGNLYLPECPELSGPIFGPRLLATIGWLKSVGHCSYSTIETWLKDVLQVPVSRGYLARLCWCITAATFSLFHITATRSREVLEKLVGPEFASYLNFGLFTRNSGGIVKRCR